MKNLAILLGTLFFVSCGMTDRMDKTLDKMDETNAKMDSMNNKMDKTNKSMDATKTLIERTNIGVDRTVIEAANLGENQRLITALETFLEGESGFEAAASLTVSVLSPGDRVWRYLGMMGPVFKASFADVKGLPNVIMIGEGRVEDKEALLEDRKPFEIAPLSREKYDTLYFALRGTLDKLYTLGKAPEREKQRWHPDIQAEWDYATEHRERMVQVATAILGARVLQNENKNALSEMVIETQRGNNDLINANQLNSLAPYEIQKARLRHLRACQLAFINRAVQMEAGTEPADVEQADLLELVHVRLGASLEKCGQPAESEDN